MTKLRYFAGGVETTASWEQDLYHKAKVPVVNGHVDVDDQEPDAELTIDSLISFGFEIVRPPAPQQKKTRRTAAAVTEG